MAGSPGSPNSWHRSLHVGGVTWHDSSQHSHQQLFLLEIYKSQKRKRLQNSSYPSLQPPPPRIQALRAHRAGPVQHDHEHEASCSDEAQNHHQDDPTNVERVRLALTQVIVFDVIGII